MDIKDRITEVCHYFTLCNKDYNETLRILPKSIRVSHTTFKKYIIIGNQLDYCLQEKLIQKGKHKLSISFAHLLSTHVKNIDHQYDIYLKMCQDNLSNKEKINSIHDYTVCPICYEQSFHQEKLPCCGSLVCLHCLYKHLDISINSIAFTGCKCPICNTTLSHSYIYDILYLSHKNKTKKWIRGVYSIYSFRGYYRNCFQKLNRIIERIEFITKKNINKLTMNLDEITDKNLYYGTCTLCCPKINNTRKTQFFTDLKINTVEKQCVNSQGDLVILKDEMFSCDSCTSTNNEYKKCPHCGIKTLRPTACNYVICGDHRWCFICNERLPNNHNGHNVHFWTGPGSSPFSNQCRTSINYNGPHFILDWCDCNSCKKGHGAPLCMNLDCYNRSPILSNNHFQKLCQTCS